QSVSTVTLEPYGAILLCDCAFRRQGRLRRAAAFSPSLQRRMLVAYRRATKVGIWVRTRRLLSLYALIGSSVLLLIGCSSAPSRNILGSYFPSWMICALIGMVLTVVVRVLLAKTGIDAVLPMPIVVYLAFAIAFSLAIWLLWLA